ncbi:MAG: hypothetical protein CMJ18_22635 [Phycisphaeraceae bacterium]|nr:hypothetical protein [Phycisphaeraceae bacterium]
MAQLRIGIGRFYHESNSFSTVPATAESFRAPSSNGGTVTGPPMLTQEDRSDEVTGFVDVLGEDAAAEAVPLLNTGTLPSGPVTPDGVRFLEDTLRRQLHRAGPLDGICIALHGAMSATDIDDLDGYLLDVIRQEVGHDLPVVVALDCHAVVTRRMIDLSDAMTAFRTHPHTDLVETGQRAARILLDLLRRGARPVVGHRRLPMLFVDPGTLAGPLKRIFEKIVSWDDRDGVISCSLCPSFPYQDVPEQGWTVLAVTRDDEALAERLADELAEEVWSIRHQLLSPPLVAPDEAVRRAVAVDGAPVVITDSADNVGGGAPGDTTTMLEMLLAMRDQVDGLILAHLPDAGAIARIASAGVGDEVHVAVGARMDTAFSEPLPVTGRVTCVTGGQITNDGRFGNDAMIDIGAAVCLAVDNVRLVLTERVIMGPQPSLFRKVGLEPFDAKIVMLKSTIGYRVTYGHVAKAVIPADCPGAMSANMTHFDFKRVPRPIFPLDPDAAY